MKVCRAGKHFSRWTALWKNRSFLASVVARLPSTLWEHRISKQPSFLRVSARVGHEYVIEPADCLKWNKLTVVFLTTGDTSLWPIHNRALHPETRTIVISGCCANVYVHTWLLFARAHVSPPTATSSAIGAGWNATQPRKREFRVAVAEAPRHTALHSITVPLNALAQWFTSEPSSSVDGSGKRFPVHRVPRPLLDRYGPWRQDFSYAIYRASRSFSPINTLIATAV